MSFNLLASLLKTACLVGIKDYKLLSKRLTQGVKIRARQVSNTPVSDRVSLKVLRHFSRSPRMLWYSPEMQLLCNLSRQHHTGLRPCHLRKLWRSLVGIGGDLCLQDSELQGMPALGKSGLIVVQNSSCSNSASAARQPRMLGH